MPCLMRVALPAALLALAAAVDLPVWPRPSKVGSTGQSTVKVAMWDSFFVLAGASNRSTFMDAAFSRYQKLVFPHRLPQAVAADGDLFTITGVALEIKDLSDDHPQLHTDESYSLTVPAEGEGRVTIQANTVYGALRGLETFSQLVKLDFDAARYYIANAPIHIEDAPRFPHRGLMIDTARHYQSLAHIRAMIDSMPYAKMNVMHWHMVDLQSFPFESKTSPKLWEGSWSMAERYFQTDVADIVEYARLRGVRVMIEFDMPGHAQSWCKGYPEVCPSQTCQMPLNVASNATFDLIEKLIGEITGGRRSQPGLPSGLIPDDFMHLGGDEVDTSCWGKTPSVAAWLKANDMTEDQAYAYFVKRVAEMVLKTGHRPVQWSEVFRHFKDKLDKNTIIHSWLGDDNITEIVSLGYNTIVNTDGGPGSWYLDGLGGTWDKIYKVDPCKGVPTEELCKRVLGGQGEMWGETVDGSDFESTIWPRLAAIAEMLWTPREQTRDAESAHQRIENFRCLLLFRGVAAAPVDNKQARQPPTGPASCFKQGGKMAAAAGDVAEIMI